MKIYIIFGGVHYEGEEILDVNKPYYQACNLQKICDEDRCSMSNKKW